MSHLAVLLALIGSCALLLHRAYVDYHDTLLDHDQKMRSYYIILVTLGLEFLLAAIYVVSALA